MPGKSHNVFETTHVEFKSNHHVRLAFTVVFDGGGVGCRAGACAGLASYPYVAAGNVPRLVGQVLGLVAETVVCAVLRPSGLRCPGLLSLLLTHRVRGRWGRGRGDTYTKCLLNRTGLALPHVPPQKL